MDGQDGGLVDAQSAISLTVLGTQVTHKSLKLRETRKSWIPRKQFILFIFKRVKDKWH